MTKGTPLAPLCTGALCIAAGLAVAILTHGGFGLVIALILALLGLQISAGAIGSWISDKDDDATP